MSLQTKEDEQKESYDVGLWLISDIIKKRDDV